MPKPIAVVAYVPVIQSAYVELIRKYPKANVYVLGMDVLAKFDHLRKDIRALEPTYAATALTSLKLTKGNIAVVDHKSLGNLTEETIILPQDDLATELEKLYFQGKNIKLEPIFLRWDRSNTAVNQAVSPDKVIKADDFQNQVIKQLYEEAGKASNWWRRVGAAIVKDGRVVLKTHNQNMPTQYSSAIDGDPRSSLNRGAGIEHTNDVHAEAYMIAQAAREGTALSGSSIYVDTFPCPKCAKDIVNAGIKECYYLTGYAMTDGLSLLNVAEVSVIQIKTKLMPPPDGAGRPYPEKN